MESQHKSSLRAIVKPPLPGIGHPELNITFDSLQEAFIHEVVKYAAEKGITPEEALEEWKRTVYCKPFPADCGANVTEADDTTGSDES